MLQPGGRPLAGLPATSDLGRRLASAGGARRLVLICFPSGAPAELRAGLTRFQESLTAFSDIGGEVVGVTNARAAELDDLTASHGLRFPLLGDPAGGLLAALDVVAADGRVMPTVYLLDEAGIVRATYEADRYPNLPNPAAVARTARKLNDAPRPAAITDADWRLGPHDAAVTLIEYSDYQCRHCAALHAALKAVERDFGDRVLVVHRHLPLRATHPLAQLAAEAAEAAGAQGRFWAMHDRLFAAQDAHERDQLIAYAAEIGLDVERFTAELDDRRHQEAVNEDFRRAVAAGIKLPPTLFINGVPYEGGRTAEELCARIVAVLLSW